MTFWIINNNSFATCNLEICLFVVGCDSSETIYLHNALEDGWRMESNSVKSWWFYQTSLWNKLRWNIASSGSCKLPPEKDIFLWPPLLRGGTPTGIQVVPSNAGMMNLKALNLLHIFAFMCLVPVTSESHTSCILHLLQKAWCLWNGSEPGVL